MGASQQFFPIAVNMATCCHSGWIWGGNEINNAPRKLQVLGRKLLTYMERGGLIEKVTVDLSLGSRRHGKARVPANVKVTRSVMIQSKCPHCYSFNR